MAVSANNSSNSTLALLVQSNVSDIDENQFELTNDEDWGEDIEEIDPYNYTQIQHKPQNKTPSNKWVCTQCNYSNKRISAIKNDYKCIKCNYELLINDIHKNQTDANQSKADNKGATQEHSVPLVLPATCEFVQPEIQINMTKEYIKKISVHCKIDNINDVNNNEYFIKFENDTTIQINKELDALLSLSTEHHSDFGQDLFVLLYDDFNRFNIMCEINNISA
eukprot:484752_1